MDLPSAVLRTRRFEYSSIIARSADNSLGSTSFSLLSRVPNPLSDRHLLAAAVVHHELVDRDDGLLDDPNANVADAAGDVDPDAAARL